MSLRFSKMPLTANLISCNRPIFLSRAPSLSLPKTLIIPKSHLKHCNLPASTVSLRRSVLLHVCRSSLGSDQQNSEETVSKGGFSGEEKLNGSGEGRDWTTSILLFGFWGAILYYVFNLTPNQTPFRDVYFLEKLLNLRGDDGFQMNQVLVALWYVMGLWPLVYSMLLIPSGRSSNSKVPVWPFLLLSCFGGAYALLPYFVLWKPPPPVVEEVELKSWSLNFLESKITAGITLAAGLGIVAYAGVAGEDVWKEFYQYFRESKFIHVMSLDFSLLSTFSAFWVYNDMTARKWYDEGSWLLPVALIPFLGPALYILLRPPLSKSLSGLSATANDD